MPYIKYFVIPKSDPNADKIIEYAKSLGSEFKTLTAPADELFEQNSAEKANEKLKNTDIIISAKFSLFGIPANLSGYHYLKSAINLVLNDPTYLRRGVTSRIYPDIASTFSTKSPCVERAIRNAISVAWDRGNAAELDNFFDACVSEKTGRVSNSVFIAKMVEFVEENSQI